MLGLLSQDRQTDRELTEVEVIHAVSQQNVIEHCDVRVVVSRQTDRELTEVEVIHAVSQQNVTEHCDVRVVVSRQTDRQTEN